MIELPVHKATGWEKIIGLIGTRQPKTLLLETRFGIHTFGVRFPLDILILDDQNCIQYMKESLRPNRIFVWNPKFKTVIELPQGTIKKYHITRGIKIHMVPLS